MILDHSLYFFTVVKIALMVWYFRVGHCCCLLVSKYGVLYHNLSHSAAALKSGLRLHVCFNKPSALLIGGARMDVTMGPACDVAIATAEVKAMAQVWSSVARILGSSVGGCSFEVRSSISRALLTAIKTPG